MTNEDGDQMQHSVALDLDTVFLDRSVPKLRANTVNSFCKDFVMLSMLMAQQNKAKHFISKMKIFIKLVSEQSQH